MMCVQVSILFLALLIIGTETAHGDLLSNLTSFTAIVGGPEGSPQFYLAIISITVQLGT